MRGAWASIALAAWVVALCAAQSKSGQRPLLVPHPPVETPPQPPDSGKKCSCLGLVRRTLDCSGRGRSTIGPKELCTGRTTAVDLSKNRFVALPASWGSHIVSVNVSRNQLTALPRAPPLNAQTHTLDVSSNRIVHSSDELRSLSKLETLVVSGNHLTALGFLPSPCALRRLNADRNHLRNLEGPLNACKKLERLDLSKNQLSALPRGVFDGLKELEFLSLAENQLTELPALLFSQLKELEHLHLDRNKISSIASNTFSGLKVVERISLSNNNLNTLPQGIFSGLVNLERLNLEGNKLRYLPNGIFSGLQELKEITLYSNGLENLPPQVFFGLSSLKRVILAENKLSSLPDQVFADVSSLDALDLSANHLTSVPAQLFRGVKSVKTLDLSLNRLTSLSGSQLGGLRSVERLDLSGNQFQALPVLDAAWPQVSLTVLDANGISEMSEAAARSWLGDSRKRRVDLGNRPPGVRSLPALRWALDDSKVKASLDATDCRCGALKRGDAHISFCTSVVCPGQSANWIEAVRATRPQPHQPYVKY